MVSVWPCYMRDFEVKCYLPVSKSNIIWVAHTDRKNCHSSFSYYLPANVLSPSSHLPWAWWELTGQLTPPKAAGLQDFYLIPFWLTIIPEGLNNKTTEKEFTEEEDWLHRMLLFLATGLSQSSILPFDILLNLLNKKALLSDPFPTLLSPWSESQGPILPRFFA